MIDLRSDTCSRPTADMRTAMANAEVGADVYDDDPTVKAVERATADLLGKEDVVYMPTGTMTNPVGIHRPAEFLRGKPGGRGIYPKVLTAVVEVRASASGQLADRGD
jgi:Beta-eliminating lyase